MALIQIQTHKLERKDKRINLFLTKQSKTNVAPRTCEREKKVSLSTEIRLKLLREIIAIYFKNHMKSINTLCEQNVSCEMLNRWYVYLPILFQGLIITVIDIRTSSNN